MFTTSSGNATSTDHRTDWRRSPSPAAAAERLSTEEAQAIAGADWLGEQAHELAWLLTAMAEIRRLPAGTALGRGTARGHDEWCGVARGVVKLCSTTAAGQLLIVRLVEPGDWFGRLPLFDDAPAALDLEAHACTDITLLSIRQRELAALLQQRPELALAFARLYGRRASQMQARFADAVSLSLEQRLIAELLGLAQRFGVACAAGTRIALRLTQQDLANLLGASRQRTNGALKRLERQQLLRVEISGALLLRDEAGLRTMML